MNINFNSETEFLGHYKGKEIKDVLIDNLNKCDSFCFSVSFILDQGLDLLFNSIEKALKRGSNGVIITTDYMRVTTESSLKRLLALQNSYSNFKVYFLESSEIGNYKSFHTKGYVFKSDNVASIIIGSSNMSKTALSKDGGEWSLFSKTYSTDSLYVDVNDEILKNINEIKDPLSENQISKYVNGYLDLSFDEVKPNFMQIEALQALNKLRIKGQKSALIVAAMGSGKTYLSAFDAKDSSANRILYICHSETILSKARIEYENVFKGSKTYGMFTGRDKERNADVIFSTNITMSNHLNEFPPDRFDYIVIDEAHHAPANTYSSIVQHFKPNFLLGMTGTPDRTDQLNARNVFKNNVPYELNLRDAIKCNLIMPFKYFSIYDSSLDYDNKTSDESIVDAMTSSSHIAFIKKQIDMHKNDVNGKVKCLAFCVNVDHSIKMAHLMSLCGYKSTYITGETDVDERNKIFKQLQDENDDLKIVFSINVLNEGVDLPDVNMSLFLRPTQSSIIFIQQLGRILRKSENKLKPIVLDFIGCKYARSTFIAWALGELVDAPVLTKPILTNILNGESQNVKDLGVEIVLDDNSKKDINEYLRKSNFNSFSILNSTYHDLKKRYSLATYPCQSDFVSKYDGFDLMRIIYTNKSYYRFLKRIKEENVPEFSNDEVAFIDFLSSHLPLTRIYEFTIVRTLIENGKMTRNALKEYVKASVEVDYKFNNDSYDHAIRALKMETFGENTKNNSVKYLKEDDTGLYIDIHANDRTILEDTVIPVLNFENYEFRSFVMDLLNYGIYKYRAEHSSDGSYFELYKCYSRKEFTRIACENSIYTNMTGLITMHIHNKMALFVDLIKDKDADDNLNYGDQFITKNKFIWESQTDTQIGNNKYNKLIAWKKYSIFVRKYKEEDNVNLPYVYLGEAILENPQNSSNKGKTVKFDCILDNELPDYLFDQFNIKIDN